jgi:4-carboxymuconolactone decarboxylase
MIARLAGFLPGDLTEEQAAVYQAISGGPRAAGPQLFALTDGEGRLRGPFNAMLLSPVLAGNLIHAGEGLSGGRVLARLVIAPA